MTNREFYTAVANGTINEEIVAHATSAIEKMDAALANRKNKPNKKALENAPIIESILGVLTTEPMTAAAVAEAVGEYDELQPKDMKLIKDETVQEEEVQDE